LIHLHEAGDRDALRWCITQMMMVMRAGRPGATLAARIWRI
jgi:hypothetical protein